MADENYTLVGDNDAPAEWADVNDVTPEQKVLIATVDEKSGNLKAGWRPSSQAAVFIEKTITTNGVYDPQQENADGYSMVTVNTPVADLGTKTITENGTYLATEDSKDGYSEVTVNVPTPVSDKNAKFGATPAAFDLKKNIVKIDIPSGVTSLEGSAFNGSTALTEVNIPDTVTTFGNSVFNGCTSLSSITLPSALTSIGAYVFENCSALTSIEIPSTVTSIGSYTFNGCTNLATITIHKAEGSITGSPWGAGGSTQIVWDGE